MAAGRYYRVKHPENEHEPNKLKMAEKSERLKTGFIIWEQTLSILGGDPDRKLVKPHSFQILPVLNWFRLDF